MALRLSEGLGLARCARALDLVLNEEAERNEAPAKERVLVGMLPTVEEDEATGDDEKPGTKLKRNHLSCPRGVGRVEQPNAR